MGGRYGNERLACVSKDFHTLARNVGALNTDSGQCLLLVPKLPLGNQRDILVGGAYPKPYRLSQSVTSADC